MLNRHQTSLEITCHHLPPPPCWDVASLGHATLAARLLAPSGLAVAQQQRYVFAADGNGKALRTVVEPMGHGKAGGVRSIGDPMINPVVIEIGIQSVTIVMVNSYGYRTNHPI